MRRRVPLLAAAATLAFTLAGCEGPTGPQGPQGPEGPAGPQGPQGQTGAAGQSANQNCILCHTDDTGLYARQVQYQASVHFTGGNFERSTTDCAPCHTHEGFMEVLATGATRTAANITNPSPVNCRTCHRIHTTYTPADYGLTRVSNVSLMATPGATVDFGDGNLCASCHQARPVSPMPAIGGADVKVTSSRFGTHHSPVAQIMGGEGLFEFQGPATINGGAHFHGGTEIGCPTCHMAQAFGAQAGGHTFAMSYDYHGSEVDNVAGCNTSGCHKSVEDFSKFGLQEDVDAKMEELATLLRKAGIMAAAPSVSAVVGTYPANVAAAFLNWQTIEEDKSHGIHNPDYIRAVLRNSIEVMKALQN